MIVSSVCTMGYIIVTGTSDDVRIGNMLLGYKLFCLLFTTCKIYPTSIDLCVKYFVISEDYLFAGVHL